MNHLNPSNSSTLFVRVQCFVAAALAAVALVLLANPGAAVAQEPTEPTPTVASGGGTSPSVTTANGSNTLTVDLSTGKSTGAGSGPLQIILVVTIIALAPAILMLVTAFTRIVIVLGLTRNALNLQGVPPNQVLIGIALFFTIFVMAPVMEKANDEGLQPYLDDKITQQEALTRASAPFKTFMLEHVREPDLALFVDLSGKEAPADPEDIPFTTLIPAFVIGELRAGIPHRVRDLHTVSHHRHSRIGNLDVDGHGDGAAGNRRVAVQALAFRTRRRLVASGRAHSSGRSEADS